MRGKTRHHSWGAPSPDPRTWDSTDLPQPAHSPPVPLVPRSLPLVPPLLSARLSLYAVTSMPYVLLALALFGLITSTVFAGIVLWSIPAFLRERRNALAALAVRPASPHRSRSSSLSTEPIPASKSTSTVFSRRTIPHPKSSSAPATPMTPASSPPAASPRATPTFPSSSYPLAANQTTSTTKSSRSKKWPPKPRTRSLSSPTATSVSRRTTSAPWPSPSLTSASAACAASIAALPPKIGSGAVSGRASRPSECPLKCRPVSLPLALWRA